MNIIKSGFTIVELLIVIVIIGILASITTVAYAGLQNRADTTKAAASIDAVSKMLEMYRLDHGSWPLSNDKYYCIGTAENYPASAPFAAGTCSYWAGGEGYFAIVDSNFNNLLRQYSNTLPNGSLNHTIEGDGYSERGVYYFASTYEPNRAYLTYRVNGDQPCPRGVKQNWYAGMTACEVVLSY